MSRRVITAAVAMLASLGFAASQASAATLVFDRPCVNSARYYGVAGTGFVPGSTVKVEPRDGIFSRFSVDPAGNFAGQLRASGVDATNPRRNQPVEVVATDDTTGQSLASATILTTYPRMFLLPRVIDARRKLTVSIRGLRPGIPAYGHVRLRGKWVRTLALGTPQRPCGALKVKSPLLRNLRFRGVIAQAYVQIDHNPQPNVISQPAGYARVLLRRPVGYAFYRYRAQVLRFGFHDAVVPPPATN